MIKNADERADVLNAIQEAVDKLGYVVAGYEDDIFLTVMIDVNEFNERWKNDNTRSV